jgi:hypothetical protein
MNEPASNVAVNFIFKPKRDVAELLRLIAQVISVFAREAKIDPHPETTEDAKSLGGDVDAFFEAGDQMFLTYQDNDGHPSALYIAYESEPTGVASLLVTVRAGLLDNEQLNIAWLRSVTLARSAIPILKPLLLQVNGMADGATQGFNRASDFVAIRPDWFLTPFAYFDATLADRSVANMLGEAGAEVAYLCNGCTFQAVHALRDQPVDTLGDALDQLPANIRGYVQISARS